MDTNELKQIWDTARDLTAGENPKPSPTADELAELRRRLNVDGLTSRLVA